MYIKIIEGNAFCRVEESLSLNQILPEAFDNIRHPFRSIEELPNQIQGILSQLEDSIIKKILNRLDELEVRRSLIH